MLMTSAFNRNEYSYYVVVPATSPSVLIVKSERVNVHVKYPPLSLSFVDIKTDDKNSLVSTSLYTLEDQRVLLKYKRIHSIVVFLQRKTTFVDLHLVDIAIKEKIHYNEGENHLFSI